MNELHLKAKEFKKMIDPCDKTSKHIKYVCYVQANTIPQEIDNWMSTNPREQKMSTNVAQKIKNSLTENSSFHELNRGILLSAKSVEWKNGSNELIVSMDDPEKHGNIDGGHTLRAILEAKNSNTLPNDRYVFMEIFEGLETPVELAAARNTSVQVDLKSIAELENSFEVLKNVFKDLSFSNRIQYKMNEHYNVEGISTIDIRELIAILLMFSQEVYPYRNGQGDLSESQPIQCYSGKEASLRKFLYMGGGKEEDQKIKRELMINNMRPIIPQIFELWEEIEITFANVSNKSGKRYGTRKYSRFEDNNIVGKSFLGEKDLKYIIPKGLMYPIVGAFRALVKINDDGTYYWQCDPIRVWNEIGSKLVTTILDEKTENPDILAKNTNLWSNLFKEVFIYGYMK
ncbi:AIPR protein [Kineothrix alysoides]|uniref:AIPR protein n=1 Tax=Kineothrix alysoides TaxID=1469948 RepID=A0A4R1QZL9_9FIRM|nr:AIPR family protein [Kineothrix alysoides]TCL58440.1 AIPR protein [Kineothrix alysoides]